MKRESCDESSKPEMPSHEDVTSWPFRHLYALYKLVSPHPDSRTPFRTEEISKYFPKHSLASIEKLWEEIKCRVDGDLDIFLSLFENFEKTLDRKPSFHSKIKKAIERLFLGDPLKAKEEIEDIDKNILESKKNVRKRESSLRHSGAKKRAKGDKSNPKISWSPTEDLILKMYDEDHELFKSLVKEKSLEEVQKRKDMLDHKQFSQQKQFVPTHST